MTLSLLRELPARRDAVVQSAREAHRLGATTRRIGLSSLEAPSAVAAVREFFGRHVDVEVADVPVPDPRLPVVEVPFVLWRYLSRNGSFTTEAEAALPPPLPHVTGAVTMIAATPYNLPAWSLLADAIVPQLDGASTREVLAAMVHPADVPDACWPWDWRFLSQVAAAVLVARIEHNAEVSIDQSSLLTVLRGPADWATTAAIVGLLELARHDAERGRIISSHLLQATAGPGNPIWDWCAT
jgi:hypothetical protein